MKDTVNAIKEMPKYFDLIHLIDVLKWPICAIVCVLIFRKVIIDILKRLTKIGIGGVSAEIPLQQQQSAEKQEHRNKSDIDKAIGLYSEQTLEYFKKSIINESGIEKIQGENKKIEHLIKYTIAIDILKVFESCYNSIFGSQLTILQQVNTSSLETEDTLKIFYDAAAQQFPKTFENYHYDQYLNFMYSTSLIVKDGERIGITYLGKDFLIYLTQTGKTVYKPN